MRELLGVLAWTTVGVILAQGLLSASPTHTASLCEDIKLELDEAVARQDIRREDARTIYNRCITSIRGN